MTGTWHTDTRRGQPREPERDETRFWAFVDLGTPDGSAYYLVPAWWIENEIHATHAAYLARHGGRRARNPASTHHAVQTRRIEEWRDRWDLLRVCAPSETR
ncbi:MAG: hypothetical protein H0W05_01625 [Thermoleophilaceae bacterium]|jgi:hypothetical protein|nr:hypothetical protein [Thermoleophilaceae bacterium]